MKTQKSQTIHKVPKIKIDLRTFAAYIKEHPRKKFQCGSTRYCPIAEFVNSQLPEGMFAAVAFSGINIYVNESGNDKRISKFKSLVWMQRFISSYDAMLKDLTGAAIVKKGLVE